MPWNATDPLKERTKFLLEWERRWNESEGGAINMAELCRMFGVSRPTGYCWVERYKDAKFDISRGVAERSRKPKNSPTSLAPEMEDLIVAARKLKPKWGPRKLHTWLVEGNPGVYVPSASVMAKVLKKRGMTTPRKKRRRATASGVASPFSGCDAPNSVWCIDFKGWFLTSDGQRCYPLTLLDAFSRYLLRCEALLEPNGKNVTKILDSAFSEFGMPSAIRSDGGPPFASTGPARLTELSVWLLRLGVRIEIIAPGKPQQNGRLERLHRTLQEETASPAAEKNCALQQRRFDSWRAEYNQERPHEALQMKTPARIYTLSSKSYPRPLVQHRADPFNREVRVDKNGFIKWDRMNVFISSALKHEYIELESSDRGWNVYWGAIPLGTLDEHRRDRGLIIKRARRGAREVSGMSYDNV